jgi:hypothetical protein
VLTECRHLNEQLRRAENELELLKEPNSRHPEFLAQMRCIDERRNGKIRYEDTFLSFEIQALRVRTVAERDQHHSQYFQECRKIRDESLEGCYKEYFALKNDRMRYGAVESPDLLLYNPKRSDQILQQTKKSLEISILSGISKHRGFAAAPDIASNSATDIDRDLQAMGVSVLDSDVTFGETLTVRRSQSPLRPLDTRTPSQSSLLTEPRSQQLTNNSSSKTCGPTRKPRTNSTPPTLSARQQDKEESSTRMPRMGPLRRSRCRIHHHRYHDHRSNRLIRRYRTTRGYQVSEDQKQHSNGIRKI